MEKEKPYLYVKVDKTNYALVAGVYNENQNFEIVEKKIRQRREPKKKILDTLHELELTIKENLPIIENKLDYVFKEINLVLDNFNYSCINVSGFKKLNGSQLLKENISYILNNLKLNIIDNEQNKTILHIFNSKSILDGNSTDNLPIGLFGKFYSHELTFLLAESNQLKNIKSIFGKNNLKVAKIFIKDYVEGVKLTNNDKNIENFFNIRITNENAQIFFFERGSLRYSENFPFGTDIIIKDIVKICSIKFDVIKKMILNKIFINDNFEEDEFIEKENFNSENFRKIRKKLIKEISDARIDEIIKIILHQNINCKIFKQKVDKIYFSIEDKSVFENFKKSFENHISSSSFFEIEFNNEFELEDIISKTAHLSIFGWRKEAIPIAQTKNTIITRIFKTLFG